LQTQNQSITLNILLEHKFFFEDIAVGYAHKLQIDLSNSDLECALETVNLMTRIATQTAGPEYGHWMWQPEGTNLTISFSSEAGLHTFAETICAEAAAYQARYGGW
jgi:hypothetical protein